MIFARLAFLAGVVILALLFAGVLVLIGCFLGELTA